MFLAECDTLILFVQRPHLSIDSPAVDRQCFGSHTLSCIRPFNDCCAFIQVPCSTQSVYSVEAVSCLGLQSWMGRHSDTGCWGRNLKLVQGAGDSSPTFRQGHCGICNVQQLMLADGMPGLTSILGMAQTLINRPACETAGWQFIAGSGFERR